MKKSILVLTVSAIIAGGSITSCNSPAQKVKNAQSNVTDAKEDLAKVNAAYLADIENYKEETAERIAINNESIAEFKARIETEKKDAKADYKKKIAGLEQKNSDLKKKIDDYKEEGKEKWSAFKAEFSHDMDELGKAFDDLTVRNVK